MNKTELLECAQKLGIREVNKANRIDEIRSAINAKLGNPDIPGLNEEQQDEVTDSYAAVVVQAGDGAIAGPTGAVHATAKNIPNLSPSGVWHGKRARLRRIKTGNNDMAGAIFNWNGWPCIIPIDAAYVDVAWPIYEIIRGCIGMRLSIRQEQDPRTPSRVSNILERTDYDKYPFEFMGVTPGTEQLPESAWEYTLDRYVEDFNGYTVRMWRQLCVLWEIPDEHCKIMAGMLPEDESAARRNAIHYHLNLPQGVDRQMRERVRDEKRADIGMTAKAA